MKRLLALAGILLLTACSSAPKSDDPFEARDPLRPVNEQTFAFNVWTDTWVMRPVAKTYHQLPEWSRYGVDNFLTNLGEPANVVNAVLQRDIDSAAVSLWRFILNTTFGLGGVRDFAGENGLKYKDQNFGKTLGSFNVPEGDYVVLPIVGPSTLRDTTGKVVDWVLDPVGWFLTTPEDIAQTVVDGIDTRDQNDAIVQQLYYDSLDPYSATRATYLQHQGYIY